MERVKKETLAIYGNNYNNVVAIKGAFGMLNSPTLICASCGVMVLPLTANNIANQYIDKGVSKKP